MPSGSKRRKKAASKKKEEVQNAPHDLNEKDEVSSFENDKDESGDIQYPSESEVKKVSEVGYCSLGGESPAIEKVKNLNFEFVTAKSSEILLEKLNDEASTASKHDAAKEEVKYFSLGGESPASDKCYNIAMQRSNENVTETSENPVLAQDDSSPFEFEERRGLPNLGTVIESSVFLGISDDQAAAPQLEHRASIWNCCGLLDVFKGAQR